MEEKQSNNSQQTPPQPDNKPDQPQPSNVPSWKLRPEKPKTKFSIAPPPLSQFIIWLSLTLVLIILTNLLTASFFLSQNKSGSQPSKPSFSLPTILSPFTSSTQTGSTNSQPSDESQEAVQPGKSTIPKVKHQKDESVGPLDFAHALNQASDTRRKADLTQIAAALNIYVSENGPPEDFPTEQACIGKTPDCYDLITLLTPEYIAQFPMDPQNGSEEFTGYYFYMNKQGSFTLSANGKVESTITLTR